MPCPVLRSGMWIPERGLTDRVPWNPVHSAMCLRAWYDRSGTDPAYGATRVKQLTQLRSYAAPRSSAVPDRAYGVAECRY
eukprot:3726910-Rhodomonas_salina.2